MSLPSRLAHMLQVGRTCEWLAAELFDWPEEKCRQMFLLGFLHDVGYAYAVVQDEHPEIGGELLRQAGYQYWQEVCWHGVVDAPYGSDELLLLNIADMLTDGQGCLVTKRERLDDIQQRYGLESEQYLNAVALCEEVDAAFCSLLIKSTWLQALWIG